MTCSKVDKLSVQLCRDNPDNIFVFGDNLTFRGKRGQAIIRDEPNAFGIPTKRLPTMSSNAFFNDREDEEKSLMMHLNVLKSISEHKDIVFPSAGLGTGLARMDEKSPDLFKKMNDFIYNNFGIRYYRQHYAIFQSAATKANPRQANAVKFATTDRREGVF